MFLYEASATAQHRINLASIRKGQFEGMAEKVQQPEWEPDFGGRKIHPTAGVVAVGARAPLIAFNVNLSTSDVAIADKIARVIRYSGGGLSCVKAIGVLLKDRNVAQVFHQHDELLRKRHYIVLLNSSASRRRVTA